MWCLYQNNLKFSFRMTVLSHYQLTHWKWPPDSHSRYTILLENWIKYVLLRFRDGEFTRKHLVIRPKGVLRSFWNWYTFWLVINMLVSSANNMRVALCVTALGKSLIYKRNKRGPKTEPCGTPCFTLVHFETVFEFFSSSLVAPPYRGEEVLVRQWSWELYQR
jgi:hypothetical protein